MRTFAALTVATGLCFSGAAVAQELHPAAAVSLTLGPVTGVAYYTAETDGYRVVTTLSSGALATPIRFVATLQPGQKTIVSVPGEPGSDAISVEIARDSDRVRVGRAEKLARLGQ
jgi:hypothetical protein